MIGTDTMVRTAFVLWCAGAAALTPAAGGQVTSHVNAQAFRDELTTFADRWDTATTTATGWNGLFYTNLDREFDKVSYAAPDHQTVVSQARLIYVNAVAARYAAPADRARFVSYAQQGTDYLIQHGWDSTNGGFFFGLRYGAGSPAPADNKWAYAQVQSILGLAEAYRVTGDPDHADAALAGMDVWNNRFGQRQDGKLTGGFLPGFNRTFTVADNARLDQNYMLHGFEAMLSLHSALPAAHPRRADVAAEVKLMGDFLTTTMFRPLAGSPGQGFVPFFFDAGWTDPQDANKRYASPGHDVQIAFLLSRAAEQGFDQDGRWLAIAEKLLTFGVERGMDRTGTSPTFGMLLHDTTDFNGQPITNDGTPNIGWWETAELARTLLHFAAVRGRTDLWDEYDAAIDAIQDHFIDPVHGGWFPAIDRSTLAPAKWYEVPAGYKGSIWTGGYHEASLYGEALRLVPEPATGMLLPIAFAALLGRRRRGRGVRSGMQ